MNALNKVIAKISYKMFFFWIIPISNAALALIQYLSVSKEFELMYFVRELVIKVLNPYFIGATWLILYSIWKGATKIKKPEGFLGKGSQNVLDFEKLNLENYMKSVLYAWILQLSLLISGIV